MRTAPWRSVEEAAEALEVVEAVVVVPVAAAAVEEAPEEAAEAVAEVRLVGGPQVEALQAAVRRQRCVERLVE